MFFFHLLRGFVTQLAVESFPVVRDFHVFENDLPNRCRRQTGFQTKFCLENSEEGSVHKDAGIVCGDQNGWVN